MEVPVMFFKRWFTMNSVAGVVLLSIVLLSGAGETLAWRSPPPAYWSGHRMQSIPQDHHEIRHGHDSFYFTGGRFYRRGPLDFFLIAPPLGIVVPVLPLGYVSLAVGGMTYYELNGIYYRQVPDGYLVVDYPAGAAPAVSTTLPASAGYNQVIVRSELLNVRVGPALDQDIIERVNRGSALKILGRIPEWYYIELPTGERGWVMERFVTPVQPEPQG